MFKTLFAAILMMAIAAPCFAGPPPDCRSSSYAWEACNTLHHDLRKYMINSPERTQEQQIWGTQAVDTCRNIIPGGETPTYFACLQRQPR